MATGDIVLIADVEESSRTLLAGVLRNAGYEPLEAEGGEEALELARTVAPAAAILEIPLPGLSGYELCTALKVDFGPDLPVIFLTGNRTESYDRVAGLLVGADDYLVKPYAPDELLARVRSLHTRSRPLAGGVQAKLSRRELEVLRLLAQGLTQPEIAARLTISPKTVATHIEHVLRKLGVHSRAQAVALAFREDTTVAVSKAVVEA